MSSNEENSEDTLWMLRCLELAKEASSRGEVPVGCVIVENNKLIAEAYNTKEFQQNPLGHAELIAIEKACKILGAWRLVDCTIYVNLEPCLMCGGAIQQSRFKRVVFGAKDPKSGAFGSLFSIHEDKRLNHRPLVTPEVLQKESAQLLKNFFKQRR